MIRLYRENSKFSKKFKLIFFNFLLVYEVPGPFRKVRGTSRIHFHLVSSKSDHGSPSYDQGNNIGSIILIVVPDNRP